MTHKKKYLIYALLFLVFGLASIWGVVEYLPKYFGTQSNQHAFIDVLEQQGLIPFKASEQNALTLDRTPFELKKNMTLSDWNGEMASNSETPVITIVSFWASWCAPCVEEFPSMIKLVQQFNGKIKILAISEDYSEEDILVFLKGFSEFSPNHIKVLWDKEQKILQLYKVYKMPEAFIFDKNGKLIKKVSGSINWADDQALMFFKQLI